ncbi:nitric oxide reductase activation protein NorD [Paracoccus aminovorans]|uniref:nitric oxide reductase activation protein NorD n=1 Tax=Paracoccus aminovorans TaxID=34004 RepID=UPI002B25ECEC|nr:VWA domain-containing protein [Paracoccus aminovorans]
MAHDLAPWEPEETVGKLWHRLAGRLDAAPDFSDAAATLEQMRPRLAVLFRGLGGGGSVEIRTVAEEESRHRLRLRRRLATPVEHVARASFDGEALRLPARLAEFPDAGDNRDLYLWLAACAAHAPAVPPADDPLQADLAAIAASRAMVAATLEDAPGLRAPWQRLVRAHLALRPRAGGGVEGAVEALVRAALQDGEAPVPTGPAPRGYRPFRPVPMWPQLRIPAASARNEGAEPAGAGSRDESEDGPARKARRNKADQAERKDSIILYKFEAMLSWAQFLNLNRRVEDDDPENARKAADDQDEIALGQISKAPATKLKLHLDLAPEDADHERLSAQHVYPEWDARRGAYLPDHCRVLATTVEADPAHAVTPDPAARRRIRAVRQRFQALRPARIMRPGQPDGEELDLDAALRSAADLRATGQGSDRIWRQSRPERRDLAVSILLDVSRSTESAVAGRAVIDIAREALTALAWGLDACGDRFAIQGFSSLRRDRVFLHDCKGFDEPMTAGIEARIAALRPGFYTRLGAAMRHASAGLATQPRARRLLLVLTDGKPNDLDHYEGRHGIEDSAMAVREARRSGQAVFGITIDKQAQAWFPRIFGRGGFAVIGNPDRLTDALPEIYRQLTL